MRLASFHVTEFQSVLDSGPVTIGEITCLVGKNESGKTALLQALYRLNPIRESDKDYSITDGYPRLEVSDYEDAVSRGERAPAVVVKAQFELSDDDINAVASELGSDFLKSNTITLSKDYSGRTDFFVSGDNAAAISFLCRGLPEDIRKRASGAKTAKDLLPIVSGLEADPAIAAIVPTLTKVGDHDFASFAWTEIIKPRLPKFLYFDEYYQMRGRENIEALKGRQETNILKSSDEPLLGLIELARLDLEGLLNPQRTQELKNKLEGAGNHLTRRILTYWSQNRHLQMRFDVRPARPADPEDMRSGTNIWGEVYDTRHLVSTGLGSRSHGFVWFFSFVAWYSQIQRRRDNVILLLDEPGLALHGRGQGDLLRYFEEELKPHHQVIYTTHSPFMVDPNRFDRVQIIQDRSIDVDDLPRDQQGTKVLTDILDALDDSLFPLQGALGYDIHQTLFIGPNSLLVEGASDMLYIQAISGLLEREGREGLSPKWTLTPSGGASKVPTFVRLLIGQRGMTIATLIDIQDRDRQMIENLYREKLLKKNNVVTFADFTGTKEADIEDMFEPEFYLNLVNEEYRTALQKAISKKDLVSRAPRILTRLDEYFAQTPLTRGAFSHYRPARYFHERLVDLAPQISKETKDRFEAAFASLNKLLL